MKVYIAILASIFILISSSSVFAASPSLSVRPGSGNVKVNTEFVLDILINSAGKNVSLARAVISFDPTMAQVVKAERNASLFCTYPEDEQSIDNETGLLMITGFCQSGNGDPYKTTGDSDVLARIRFKALKTGTLSIRWNYTGTDEPFKSVIMKDGSPPQNILTTKPRDASFVIVKSLDSNNGNNNNGNTPSTGFSLSIGLIVSGILLTILGIVYVRWSDASYRRKLKTVVVYGTKS